MEYFEKADPLSIIHLLNALVSQRTFFKIEDATKMGIRDLQAEMENRLESLWIAYRSFKGKENYDSSDLENDQFQLMHLLAEDASHTDSKGITFVLKVPNFGLPTMKKVANSDEGSIFTVTLSREGISEPTISVEWKAGIDRDEN